MMASTASTAVIFRRGPSRWTRLYLWNTRTDAITPGSWFAGRLYEWTSDLSPDGRHLVYLARNESKRRLDAAAEAFGDQTMWSWTALCKPPWVKALALWSAGPDGGGIFTDNHTLVLNHPASLLAQQTRIKPAGFTVRGLEGTEQIHVLCTSLERTGWQIIQRPERWYGSGEVGALILRKKKLELRFTRSPEYRWEATYIWLGTDARPRVEQASWADFDQHGRLLIARQGRLFVVQGADLQELIDLNQDQPRHHVTDQS
ncbi:hypothetical protein LAJ19_11385 [Deinococcus taeanensis]|uniref:hypothetical protein n=1 Tax=Deinococcus taeanensis TaxID=2737050 RepID=UPI001CDBF23E|nr:hypothetical protein [Deinococcus taeanensis]UBV42220.1 hypothetical protein LAJ19_11385 [Deinococcus taeanensis]